MLKNAAQSAGSQEGQSGGGTVGIHARRKGKRPGPDWCFGTKNACQSTCKLSLRMGGTHSARLVRGRYQP